MISDSDNEALSVPPILLRSAVGSTKQIGQLHWALFIVIQSGFCFGLFVYLLYRNFILTISAQMQTSAQFKFALYITNALSIEIINKSTKNIIFS